MSFSPIRSHLCRARSIYERAIDVDYRNITIWIKYAEMEMKNKFINHARNVWDRAVVLLPRVDQLWYKYVCIAPSHGLHIFTNVHKNIYMCVCER
jgi:hypothetical protein